MFAIHGKPKRANQGSLKESMNQAGLQGYIVESDNNGISQRQGEGRKESRRSVRDQVWHM